jgi:hypothetical protein
MNLTRQKAVRIQKNENGELVFDLENGDMFFPNVHAPYIIKDSLQKNYRDIYNLISTIIDKSFDEETYSNKLLHALKENNLPQDHLTYILNRCFTLYRFWSSNNLLILFLLQNGADPNSSNFSLYSSISETNTIEMFQLLVSFGGKPTFMTLLNFIKKNNVTMVKYLLENYPGINLEIPKGEYSALWQATCQNLNMEMIKLLLDFNDPVNFQCYDETPLRRAIDLKKIDLIKLFLSYGANIHVTLDGVVKLSYLDRALLTGSIEICHLFLIHGIERKLNVHRIISFEKNFILRMFHSFDISMLHYCLNKKNIFIFDFFE